MAEPSAKFKRWIARHSRVPERDLRRCRVGIVAACALFAREPGSRHEARRCDRTQS